MSLVIVIAKNVRKARTRRGLTQVELGQRLGVPQSYVAMLESGQKVPSIAMLERIAAALRVKASRLLE